MRLISYLLLFVCLTGCRYPFDLDDKNMRPMVAIQSYICADSLVAINVNKTVPLTQIGKADTALINPYYSLKCNGEEVLVRDSMIGDGGMALCSKAFKNGDELEVIFGIIFIFSYQDDTILGENAVEFKLRDAE